MNYKQLFNISIPEEQLEFAILALQTIEARQSKIILAGNRLIRERRGPFAGAHFIHDRRAPRVMVYRWLFIFILVTLYTGVTLFTIHVPAHIGAPTLAVTLAALILLLLTKPYKNASRLLLAQ